MTQNPTKEQRLAETRQRVKLDRALAEDGIPASARDHFLAELGESELMKSYLAGSPEPSLDELKATVFSTPNGKLLREILDDRAKLDAEAPAKGKGAQIEQLQGLSPLQRINQARKMGLVP